MSEKPDPLQGLLDFLDKLEHYHIYFRLDRCRSEAIMVRIDVPGERWEIEFFADGDIQTSVFAGSEAIVSGPSPLERLFPKNRGLD